MNSFVNGGGKAILALVETNVKNFLTPQFGGAYNPPAMQQPFATQLVAGYTWKRRMSACGYSPADGWTLK